MSNGPGILGIWKRGLTLPADDLELVAVRTGWLRVVVRTAAGDPVPVFDVGVAREVVGEDGEVEQLPYRSATVTDADGVWKTVTPAGRIHLTVQAPGMNTVQGFVEVPDVDRENEVALTLQSR